MSLVSQESLNKDYWHHNCTSKDGAEVYVQKGSKCFYCGKTQAQANGVVGQTTNQK